MPKPKVMLDEVSQNLASGSFRRVLVTLVAIFFVIIGTVGMVIPLFPGRTILFAGLLLLSVHSPSLHAWVKRKTEGRPRLQSRADRLRNWLINRIYK